MAARKSFLSRTSQCRYQPKAKFSCGSTPLASDLGDALLREGHSGVPQTLPLVLGSDIAGKIESLHYDGGTLRRGDEVYGVTSPSFTGGYAEYAIASVDMIAPKPRSLSFDEAPSAPVVSLEVLEPETGRHALDDCPLMTNQQVAGFESGRRLQNSP